MKYGIPVGTKVAVYAPTFRDNRNTSAYKEFDAHRFRDCLVRKTGKQWMVIVRLHPNVAFQDSLFRYDDTVLNGSQGMDGQELFLLGDLLVTDFSSVMMDFAIMKNRYSFLHPTWMNIVKTEGCVRCSIRCLFRAVCRKRHWIAPFCLTTSHLI